MIPRGKELKMIRDYLIQKLKEFYSGPKLQETPSGARIEFPAEIIELVEGEEKAGYREYRVRKNGKPLAIFRVYRILPKDFLLGMDFGKYVVKYLEGLWPRETAEACREKGGHLEYIGTDGSMEVDAPGLIKQINAYACIQKLKAQNS